MARVQRPVTRGEYDYNELPMIHASAFSGMHPWDFTDEEVEDLIAEHEALMAKKRPLGFAPWSLELED